MSTNDFRPLALMQPMKYWVIYFILSLAVIIPGIYSLCRYGLKLSIDFTGGSHLVWEAPNKTSSQLISLMQAQKISVKEIHADNSAWVIVTPPIDTNSHESLLALAKDQGISELSYSTLGPSLGSELVRKTLTGLFIAASLILLYVAYRFTNLKFGVCAILAMLHDLLVVVGVFSLLGHFYGVEVDTLFVTALLTILSFSVHDTIVVYDRIRELKKHHGYLEFFDIANRAVVETMGRSLNNSMTIIFMLFAMYLMGGDTTKWFVFALLIGTVSGTYSSTFTAVPLLVVWDKFAHRLKK